MGYPKTQLTLGEAIHHTRAAIRSTTHPLLLVDMPFGSYHASVDDAVLNAVRLVGGVKQKGSDLKEDRRSCLLSNG